jgi:hypothetical protein
MIGCMYSDATSFTGRICSAGIKPKGSNAVAYTGMASVIHHVIIHAEIANTAFADTVIPSGVGINRIRKNNEGPKTIPNNLKLNIDGMDDFFNIC